MATTWRRNYAFTAVLVVTALLIGLLASPAFAAAPTADVTFTFTDSGVAASESGTGWEISGTDLTITASGTYLITGSASEGSVKVKKSVTGVTLVLSNLTLASSKTAPVVIGKGAEATIFTLGTVTLTDKEDASAESTNEDFEGAAIKVKSGASLTLTGTGTLNADGTACKNAVKGGSEAVITIAGGTVNAGAANTGIASDGELIITGGTVNVTAAGDGIKSDPDDDDTVSKGNLTILGGTVSVTAGDDAIKALCDLTIGAEGSASGPSITVTKSAEAVEGARVFLNSGSGTFSASDDGINAASSRAVSEIAIYINGGTWFVNSEGDGLDAGGDSRANSGGSIYMNGGRMTVFGSANSGNAALDYDTTGKYSGGTILAVGNSGMAQTLGGSGVTFNASVTKGAVIAVKDAAGGELVSVTAQKSANHIYFASDAVSDGDTVTLYLNGAKSSAAAVGTTSSGGGMMGGAAGRGGFGGMMGGQRPGMNGETPADGEMPSGSEMPQGGFGGRGMMGGQRPGMNGETPADGGMPSGSEMPQGGSAGNAPSAEDAPAGDSAAEESSANPFIAWFQSIINFFKSLFTR